MVVKMRQAASILKLWKASMMQALEYRGSFAFSIIANFFDFIFGFLQYMVFFTAAQSIAGWNSDQMLVLYGVFMLVFALQFIFLYPNLVAMGDMVNSGNLDLLLTKPVNAQLILSFRRISFEELGSISTAMVLLGWLIYKGVIQLTLPSVALFLMSMVAAMLLIYCLFLLLMCLAVFLERLDNMAQLMWSMFALCRYPVDVYPSRLRFMFFSFLPFAYIASVPAGALLGTASASQIMTGMIIALTATFATTLLWRRTIRAYTSAGG